MDTSAQIHLDLPQADAGPAATVVWVSGWVRGASAVTVSWPGGSRAAQLTERPEVQAATGEAAHGFRAAVETRDLPGGQVELTVTAGRRSVAAVVDVDPAAAWAAYRRATQPASGGADGPPPAVIAILAPGEATAAERDALMRSALTQTLPALRVVTVGPELAHDTRSLAEALGVFLGSDAQYAVVADAPGRLARDALALLVSAAEVADAPDALYGDDELDAGVAPRPGGQPVRLKPAWSPALEYCGAYAGPLVAVSRTAARTALVSGAPLADTRDLLLALGRRARVAHVLRPLFALGRAPALPADIPPPGDAAPVAPVSVVIPTRYGHDRVLDCIAALGESGASEVVLMDPGPGPERDAAAARARAAGLAVCCAAYATPFSFAQACNAGAALAAGETLLFLNDDVLVGEGDWLTRLRAWLAVPGVGIVGPALVWPDGTFQQCGNTVSERDPAVYCGWGLGAAPGGPEGRFAVTRDVLAVSAACALMERETFEGLGGFDELFATDYGDVDLCLRARAAGQAVLACGGVRLTHMESATRTGTISATAAREFVARWRALVHGPGDPFWHPGAATPAGEPLMPPAAFVRLADLPR